MNGNRRTIGVGHWSVTALSFSLLVAFAIRESRADATQEVEQAFAELKSGITNQTEESFITQKIAPYGSTAIEIMVQKLEPPRFSLDQGSNYQENVDLETAVQVLTVIGANAYTGLLQHVSTTNAFLRANVFQALYHFEREECFGLLTNALTDTALNSPSEAGKANRICEEAYCVMRGKLHALGYPDTLSGKFFSENEDSQDQMIQDLLQWWSSNRLEVLEKYREKY